MTYHLFPVLKPSAESSSTLVHEELGFQGGEDVNCGLLAHDAVFRRSRVQILVRRTSVLTFSWFSLVSPGKFRNGTLCFVTIGSLCVPYTEFYVKPNVNYKSVCKFLWQQYYKLNRLSLLYLQGRTYKIVYSRCWKYPQPSRRQTSPEMLLPVWILSYLVLPCQDKYVKVKQSHNSPMVAKGGGGCIASTRSRPRH
jgi:hypothetical protein